MLFEGNQRQQPQNIEQLVSFLINAINEMVDYCLLNIDTLQLLVPLVSTFRYDGGDVNMMLARTEAKILRDKISDKDYAHEELIRILTTRSKAQINATLNHYNDAFGNAINKVLTLLSPAVIRNTQG